MTSDMEPDLGRAKGPHRLSGWFRASTDWMFPGQSIVSLGPVSSSAVLSRDEFGAIRFLSPPFCARCSYPFEHDEGGGAVCGSCLAAPPVYDRMRSPLIYGDGVSDLVLHLKRGGRRTGLRFYAGLIYQSGADLIDTADLLIPIPLHYRRLVSRGFNQAGWLATALSRRSGAPVKHGVLRRVKASPSQGHLSPGERRRNVAGAFSVRPRHLSLVQGRRIVLVDDVFTTGATVEAAARSLKRAKAANVDVVTLARVVAPRTPPI